MTAYVYWQNALRGIFSIVTEGSPQPGFYRLRDPLIRGNWLPVAIWHEAKPGAVEAVCGVGTGCTERPMAEVWPACAMHPVSEADYRAVCETGEWPGALPEIAPEPEPAPVGHNAPPDEPATLVETAEQFLARVSQITTQADADMAGNLGGGLAKLSAENNEKRETEKRPHLEAGRAVDERWREAIEKPKALAARLKALLTPWLRKVQEAKQAEASKAIAEGAEPARVKTRARAGGARGKSVTLRTITRAEIEDMAKAMTALAKHPAMIDLVQIMANRAATTGVPLPGTKIVTEQVAA